jgi:predicted transcriptional regulator
VVLILKQVNHISNNMGNRSRTEIVGNILDAANKGGTTNKNYVLCLSKLWAIKRIPFYIDRK